MFSYVKRREIRARARASSGDSAPSRSSDKAASPLRAAGTGQEEKKNEGTTVLHIGWYLRPFISEFITAPLSLSLSLSLSFSRPMQRARDRASRPHPPFPPFAAGRGTPDVTKPGDPSPRWPASTSLNSPPPLRLPGERAFFLLEESTLHRELTGCRNKCIRRALPLPFPLPPKNCRR